MFQRPHLHYMSQTMFGLRGNVRPDLRERIFSRQSRRITDDPFHVQRKRLCFNYPRLAGFYERDVYGSPGAPKRQRKETSRTPQLGFGHKIMMFGGSQMMFAHLSIGPSSAALRLHGRDCGGGANLNFSHQLCFTGAGSLVRQ